jgi:hypothetical protein
MGDEGNYARGYAMGQVDIACYEVSKGKPASVQVVRDEDVSEAAKLAAGYGLHYHVTPNGVTGWRCFWIYKRDFMLDVIKGAPDTPGTPLEHWYMGKLFGYTDEEIDVFIQTECRPESASPTTGR